MVSNSIGIYYGSYNLISDTIYGGITSRQQESLSDTRIGSSSPMLSERHFSGRPLPSIPPNERPFSPYTLPVQSFSLSPPTSRSPLPPSSLAHSTRTPSNVDPLPSLPLPPSHSSFSPPPPLPPPFSHPLPTPSTSLADALKKKTLSKTKSQSSSGK